MNHVDILVIGAGPAGLQLGYFLEKHGASYKILERRASAGQFFKQFPRHRTLISINKVYTGSTDPELNLRWDWNSLLNDGQVQSLREYTTNYWPHADAMIQYLEDFAGRFALAIDYEKDVAEVTKAGRFSVRCQDGTTYTCDRLVIATGMFKPFIPDIEGIEHAEDYTTMSIDPKDFVGQRVLIIGKGNSAFETAENLVGTTTRIHLASPNSLKMAWRTHYVGHLRAINNSFLDTYQLKSQNALIDAEIVSIERRDGCVAVSFRYSHAAAEVESLEYDSVLICAGFRFDDSMFSDSCRPRLAIQDRFPEQTSVWESTNVPSLFFAGVLTHMRDYKKKQSGFIHGFRYNVEFLARHLLEQQYGHEIEYATLPLDHHAIAQRILSRVNRSSALFQQTGYLGDVIVVGETTGSCRYYEGVPVDHALKKWRDKTIFTVTLEFGQELIDAEPDVFALDRVHKHDTENAHRSLGIHPIIRKFSEARLVETHHVIEDFLSEWNEPEHIEPLLAYLEGSLASHRSPRLQGAPANAAAR